MRSILLKSEYVYKGDLILVNKDNKIRTLIKEYNLKPIDDKYFDILFDYNANINLKKALEKIEAKDKIVPVSAYRSFNEQKEIYNTSIKENGIKFTKKYVALPNASEHQTGLAIDLGLNVKNIDFIRPKFPNRGICEKFRNIATEYGFIQRYTKNKEKITNISDEKWHFRYVGYPHSKIIEYNSLCLEEYIDYLKKFKYGKNLLIFEEYEISYIKMNEESKIIQIGDNDMVNISGNNVDGIIITKRRR